MAQTATEIDRIDIFGYDLTYAHGEYVMSTGRVIDRLPSTVIRITTRSAVEGFGETCPLGSTYLPAFGEGARAALRELAPALLGVDAANLAAVNACMDSTLRGHEYAKSAIDIACWDIFGRATGQSVAMLLGGVLQERLPLYVAVPLGEPASMQAFVERERDEGIHRFQLKLGGDPEEDRDRVAAVHAVTDTSDAIIGDANGGWRRPDGIIPPKLFQRVDPLPPQQPSRAPGEGPRGRGGRRLPPGFRAGLTHPPPPRRGA